MLVNYAVFKKRTPLLNTSNYSNKYGQLLIWAIYIVSAIF